MREIQTPQNATNTGLVECPLHLICESPADHRTVGRFALKIAPTREWHNLVKKMSGLSGLKTLEKENGFTKFHLLRGSLESPVKIRSER